LIATAIPFSLLLTISVQYLLGDSLNLLTMMGLMLAIGMAVDNAIVVVETIVTRRAAGDAPRVATVEGTASVNLAITMSTLTTMVVFLPIMVMTQEAEFSFFLRILGFAVIVTLGASLFVALVFAPFATRFFSTAAPRPEPRWLTGMTKVYRGLLTKLLTRRIDSLYGLAAMLLLTVVLPVRGVECSGADGNVMNDFSIRFTVPSVASVQERDEIVQVFEALVDENTDDWGVGGYRSRLEADSTRGRITVYLDPEGGKDRDDIVKAARAALPTEMPGVVSRIGWEGGEGSDSARVTLLGENIDTLDTLADEVIRRLETQPEVMSAMRSHEIKGQEEIRLHVDETAAERAGLNALGVAQTVSYAMRGTQLEPLVEGEREVPVVTRFRLEDRGSIEALGDFGVWSPQLFQMVPIRALTHSEVARGPYEIRRSDGVAGLQIQADFVSGTAYSDRSAIVGAALTPMEFPYGYSWDGSQGFEMPDAELATAGFAVTLSLIFVFLLMGMLFESVVLPMSVIMTVPMAAVGAFWGLYLTDTPLDAMAMVGLVILVGVVVNNGIVLVDLVTQLRAKGLPRDQALIDAGSRRFRPILMTALTTICGLIPMAFGSSTFVGLPYAPLGRIVIGGLASATVLTIFFIPVLYALLDDARSLGGPFLSFVFRKRSQ
jgi:HAE1 family hydrophobic/amphiphilic exporter-1